MPKKTNKRNVEKELSEMDDFIKNIENKEISKLLHRTSISIKCKSNNQKKLIESIKKNMITICSGLPGTGKTYLSAAQALKLLKDKSTPYTRIILIKSVTALKGEEIGYLPGSFNEKMMPIMESFSDNFKKILGKSTYNMLLQHEIIEVVPIAFARGRSIDNSIIIIDESQNISIDNIRTLMTRIGEDSKMIIIGDVKQKDIRNKQDSALEVILKNFDNVEQFGCVELRQDNDVVRNPLITTIENIFEKILEKK